MFLKYIYSDMVKQHSTSTTQLITTTKTVININTVLTLRNVKKCNRTELDTRLFAVVLTYCKMVNSCLKMNLAIDSMT